MKRGIGGLLNWQGDGYGARYGDSDRLLRGDGVGDGAEIRTGQGAGGGYVGVGSDGDGALVEFGAIFVWVRSNYQDTGA